MEWFKIDWKGAYPIDSAEEKLEAVGFGIYAIYEISAKNPTILYIGETYWQSFGKRLQQHKKEWLYRVNGRLFIHFGTVGLPENKHISHEKILDVESVLIHVLHPPFNTVSKHGYYGREIMIFNLGKIGTIPPLICPKELRSLIDATIKKR
jgi:hypothetical protein